MCENELSVTLNNDYIDNSITTSTQNKFKLKDEHDNILTGNVQWLSIENQQGCDNSDVSFILTIFPKNFWNK